MIRQGKQEGWLKLPTSALRPWAEFNGVTFNAIRCGEIPGQQNRGSGVIASRALKGGNELPLMVIPRDLVLSLDRVEQQAKADRYLRELLEALGDYSRTPRGAILVFLLHQATIACPALQGVNCGIPTPFAEYFKFLPEELLPTVWHEDEKGILIGTSLKPAVEAKLKSLQKEFHHLRSTTEKIPWCAKHWWDEESGILCFDDWKQVDSMYRSRALEFPGIGDGMVPCIDMANHAAGDSTSAIYERDSQGNAILLLRDDHEVGEDNEVTITYGDKKGACEMIFSYGFIEDTMQSAQEIFLDLQIPSDDSLGLAKLTVATVAPGFKLAEKGNAVEWHSDFIWLICVNEEDGLGFNVLQANDGSRELKCSWKDNDLRDTIELRRFLERDPLWAVFQLRAVTLIQQRVEEQLQMLHDTRESVNIPHGNGTSVRDRQWALATKLRELEMTLLEKAHGNLSAQKERLCDSEAVRKYLAGADESTEMVEQDFT